MAAMCSMDFRREEVALIVARPGGGRAIGVVESADVVVRWPKLSMRQ
jgi:hypothetical protein